MSVFNNFYVFVFSGRPEDPSARWKPCMRWVTVLHLFFSLFLYRGFRKIGFNGGLVQFPVGTSSYLGIIACIQCCGSGSDMRSVSDPDRSESFGSLIPGTNFSQILLAG
jgi:hypothetical protein